jgi:hypothetical protein
MAINNPTVVTFGQDDDGGTTAATASISPTTGGVLMFMLGIGNDTNATTAGTLTVSGLSATWTLQEDTLDTADASFRTRYVLYTSTNYTGTGTISISGIPASNILMWKVLLVTASGALSIVDTNSTKGTGTAAATTLTGSPECSIYGVFSVDPSATTYTAGTGYTELDDVNYSSVVFHTSGYDNGSPGAPAATASVAQDRWHIVALGVSEAAAGTRAVGSVASFSPYRPQLPRPFVSRGGV